jgi:hypothetical protein
MLFKSIEVGYMVEFLKSPLPWDKKVDLPHCGFTKLPAKRDTATQEQMHKRGKLKFGNPIQVFKEALTPPIVTKFNEELGKLIGKAAASVGKFHE